MRWKAVFRWKVGPCGRDLVGEGKYLRLHVFHPLILDRIPRRLAHSHQLLLLLQQQHILTVLLRRCSSSALCSSTFAVPP